MITVVSSLAAFYDSRQARVTLALPSFCAPEEGNPAIGTKIIVPSLFQGVV